MAGPSFSRYVYEYDDGDHVYNVIDISFGMMTPVAHCYDRSVAERVVDRMNAREDQVSIARWGNRMFPDQGENELITRYWRVQEELVELGRAIGLKPDQLKQSFADALDHASRPGDDGSVPDELADVQITLFYLATRLGVNLAGAVDSKMDQNQKRSDEIRRKNADKTFPVAVP